MDAGEFSKHLCQINDAAYTALLMAIGSELGLFALLMKENRPMTSLELADHAGMKERYVREWLNGAATGKIISYDPEKKTYFIPEQHHSVLKGPATWSAGIVAFSLRFEDVKKCFMKDGPYGFSYDNDSSFWRFFSTHRMAKNENTVEKAIVAKLKGTPIADKLESGISVLDIGCGSAEFTLVFGKLFPKSTFTGLEYCQIPSKMAKEGVIEAGLDNITIVNGDAQDLPDEMAGKFDLVTMIDVLHDLPDPHKALSEAYKILKPDGTLVVCDFGGISSDPEANIGNLTIAMLYTCSVFCCLPSSLSREPRIGCGTCWGGKNIETALKEKFRITMLDCSSPWRNKLNALKGASIKEKAKAGEGLRRMQGKRDSERS